MTADLDKARQIARGMTHAYQMGRLAGHRGWASLSDLALSQSGEPGWADAYRMGREAGQRDRSCIDPYASCPQMPEEGVTPPPVATNNKRG